MNVEEIHTLPLPKSPEPFRKGELESYYFLKEMYIRQKKIILLFFKRQLHGTLLIIMTGTLWPARAIIIFQNNCLEECIVTRGSSYWEQ